MHSIRLSSPDFLIQTHQIWNLEFQFWYFSDAWNLEFQIWNFIPMFGIFLPIYWSQISVKTMYFSAFSFQVLKMFTANSQIILCF